MRVMESRNSGAWPSWAVSYNATLFFLSEGVRMKVGGIERATRELGGENR
jgi:hypothetical protein